MSSNEYATPLTLNLTTSRLATSIIFFVHVAAALLILLVPISAVIKSLIVIFVLFSLWDISKRVLLTKPDSITQIVWGTDNNWTLSTHDGEIRHATLLPSTYVHEWMTALNFKLRSNQLMSNKLMSNKKPRVNAEYCRFYSCVILPDSIDADVLRRLRVRLRLAQYNLTE